MPRRVELRQLGDGRHLAQEPHAVKTTVLELAGRPGQLRGPADLCLDLPDELADLGSRRLGLFALNADQRRFVFLIGEPDLERAVGDQGDQHDRKEQNNIF
jgi:hypothetical protein